MYKFLHRHYHLRYHNVYRHAKKLFIFDLALLGLALTMLTGSLFFFFWKPGITDQIDLILSLGNNRLKSGEEVTLSIEYINRSKFKLQAVSLGVHLPNGFIIDYSKTPQTIFNSESIFTQLKEIPAGAKGKTEIHGWLWTEPNKEEKILANLSYQPEGASHREQKLSHYIINQPDSVLSNNIFIATSTFGGQKLNFKYTITNDSPITVKDIILSPADWLKNIIKEEDKKITLGPNEKKVIDGQVAIPAKSADYIVQITPQLLINNYLVPQKSAKEIIAIVTPDIISSAIFPSKISYADISQIIPLDLYWANKSKFKLENLRMKITSNYSIIDWQKTAIANNAKTDGVGLILDNNSRTKLRDGNPNSGENFTINLYLKSSFAIGQAEKAYLEITPAMETWFDLLPTQKFNQIGTKTKIPIATQVKFLPEIRYYTDTDDQIGFGPLPPQTGKTTRYWVFAKIYNGSNALKDIYFKTNLPAGVELTGKESVTIGPKISYDKNNRAITWNYSELPANSYTGIYFEVQVTPTASQIGKEIKLTDALYLTATDEWTGKKFDLKNSGLNNVLQTNDKGSKKGYLVQ